MTIVAAIRYPPPPLARFRYPPGMRHFVAGKPLWPAVLLLTDSKITNLGTPNKSYNSGAKLWQLAPRLGAAFASDDVQATERALDKLKTELNGGVRTSLPTTAQRIFATEKTRGPWQCVMGWVGADERSIVLKFDSTQAFEPEEVTGDSYLGEPSVCKDFKRLVDADDISRHPADFGSYMAIWMGLFDEALNRASSETVEGPAQVAFIDKDGFHQVSGWSMGADSPVTRITAAASELRTANRQDRLANRPEGTPPVVRDGPEVRKPFGRGQDVR